MIFSYFIYENLPLTSDIPILPLKFRKLGLVLVLLKLFLVEFGGGTPKKPEKGNPDFAYLLRGEPTPLDTMVVEHIRTAVYGAVDDTVWL